MATIKRRKSSILSNHSRTSTLADSTLDKASETLYRTNRLLKECQDLQKKFHEERDSVTMAARNHPKYFAIKLSVTDIDSDNERDRNFIGSEIFNYRTPRKFGTVFKSRNRTPSVNSSHRSYRLMWINTNLLTVRIYSFSNLRYTSIFFKF